MLDTTLLSTRPPCAEAMLLEPSLADTHAAVQSDPSLPKSTREALCCSLRRVAKFLKRDLSHLPARLGALRYGIAGLHHARLGISRKTLQNHIANLKAAVRHVSGVERLSGRGITLAPDWKVLYDQLTARRLRLGLSGFLKYCSATGIDPWSVSETSVGAFIAYATEVQFTVKPNDLHKQIARCWNRAREAVPGWPLITLTVPDFRPLPASLPWEAFALSFVQDVEHYLSLLGGENLLDEDAPDRACKPSTIKTRRVSEMLERYLSVFRPRLCRVDNPWLFPGEGIAHKTKGTLSGQIIERVIKALGIRVTPHQFRHLAAAFILERDPANYEFVRRVLGHKNLETTIRFYVGLETVDAVRKYSAMALEGHDWRPEQ